jgi:hypothetical protein
MVTGLYGRTREKYSNSQTIWSTHIISCEKCKLNPCLKRDKNYPKISFQLTIDIGKKKANFLKLILQTLHEFNLNTHPCTSAI